MLSYLAISLHFRIAAPLLLSLLLCAPVPAVADGGEETSTERRVLVSVDDTWFHRLGLSRFSYKRALRRAGLEPVLVNYRVMSGESATRKLAKRLLDGMHGLVLAGGGDVDPALFGADPDFSIGVIKDRDRFELALLEYAQRERIPVLAICRGHQLLNVARGGTLRNLRNDDVLAPFHRSFWRGHRVLLEPGSRLAQWLGVDRLERVTSYHGQAIAKLGDNLRVVARSADGVIEAVESVEPGPESGYFGLVGVQWHPEVRTGAVQMRLFEAFAGSVASPANAPADLAAE